MKRLLSTVCLTVFFGCFLGKAQVTRSSTSVTQPSSPQTQPTNISQFEVSGKLITQNSFVGTVAIPTLLQTGSFDPTASWNSMGNINFNVNPLTPLTQTINGFRSQTRGRGLAWGYSIPAAGQPNAGVLTSPFIEWIGNNGASVTPGNLEFKYAFSPTGTAAARVPAFNIVPVGVATDIPNAGANAYTNKGFIGQLQSGAFGSFGVGDTWSATGQIVTPSFTTYGARQQYEGNTHITGLIKSGTTINAVQDFGSNGTAINYRFRTFSNPSSPASVKNIWQSSSVNGNVMMGRQDISFVDADKYYLSVYDGATPNFGPDPANTIAIDRAAIYATSYALDDNGNVVPNYAAIVGDLRVASALSTKYAILGLAAQNLTSNNNWAGYFVGNVGYTGSSAQVSDKKFKKEITAETNIMEKLMQLEPKHYYFDTKKYSSMSFSDQLQHGLISQEVEKIFPELVIDAAAPVSTNGEKGKVTEYKGLNYIGFIPMLIKGIQELKIENDALKTKVENLEAKNSSNTFVINDKNNLPAEIENKAFTLSQNSPNPFSEKTTIAYTIPSNVKKATLAVFDLTGKMLLQYNLLQGKNNLQIDGNTLAAGMYLYSLLADGQEVLSKRMVLTK